MPNVVARNPFATVSHVTSTKTLVIAEKPSVGRDLASALPGKFAKHEGYLESDDSVITWAGRRLVDSSNPDEYDPD